MEPAAAWMAARIREYVQQRHTLPLMAPSISASLGTGLLSNNAVAAMTWPDWQYPH